MSIEQKPKSRTSAHTLVRTENRLQAENLTNLFFTVEEKIKDPQVKLAKHLFTIMHESAKEESRLLLDGLPGQPVVRNVLVMAPGNEWKLHLLDVLSEAVATAYETRKTVDKIDYVLFRLDWVFDSMSVTVHYNESSNLVFHMAINRTAYSAMWSDVLSHNNFKKERPLVRRLARFVDNTLFRINFSPVIH